jgi:hypothetical protein
MNELFAIDPSACRNSSDVELLIKSFGPKAGRYAVKMPGNWRELVEGALGANLRDVDRHRLKRRLEQFEKGFGIVERGGFPLHIKGSWRAEAERFALKKPPDINGLVVDEEVEPSDVHYWITDERFRHDASEVFLSQAWEYARVSRTFLYLSKEIFVIDPHLDFFKKADIDVVKALLREFAKGRHLRAVFWVRLKKDDGDEKEWVEVLRSLGRDSGLRRDTELVVNLVDDKYARDRMHGRRLLSVIGGIAFDQGFRKRTQGWNEASPMAGNVWEKYWEMFVEGKTDLKIARCVSLIL